jgi:hypothetical protein
MSVRISTIGDLKEYAAGMLGRVKDHGENINTVVYVLIGFVIVHTDEIKVRGFKGAIGNVLWCRYEGRRFVFTYTHDDGGAIVLRRRNLQGPEVALFTNESSVADIQKAFDSKELIRLKLPQQIQAHEAQL